MKIGFVQCHSDHSVLVKSSAKCIVILVVYVDDILVSGGDLIEIEEVKEYMKR